MSALSILSVLTPAAPDGAGPDASIEAAADSAMFADLVLKEETGEAPAAAPSPVRAPAAQTEPEDMGAAIAMIPIWFAPSPEPQQLAVSEPALAGESDSAPLHTPPAPEPPILEQVADASPEAETPNADAAPVASPIAPSALSPSALSAPVGPAAAATPAATAPAGNSLAGPVAAAETTPLLVAEDSEAPPDAAPAEGEEVAEPSAPARPASPASSSPIPALPGVTGFRSGAGERLASAREAIPASASAEGGSERSSAERLTSTDHPAAATAPAAGPSPATSPAAPTAPPAALAPPSADADAPVPPPAFAETVGPEASAASRDLGLSQLSRATVETTAQIAAQIIKKLDGRSTRFDMALTPEGLGRVDVSLEIESDGQVTARLAFDTPAAAADLRARADELRRQLMEAGLHLSSDDLEFAERDPSSGFGGGAFERQPDRRAFTGAARLAAEADSVVPPPSAWTSLSLTPDRVDLKV